MITLLFRRILSRLDSINLRPTAAKRSSGFFAAGLFLLAMASALGQTAQTTNIPSTPLYLMRPDYPVPYGPPKAEAIIAVLNRIRGYLETATPPRLIDRRTGAAITNLTEPNPDAVFEPGAFRLISYEWGVTYGAMLLAGETTGDPRFTAYTSNRLGLIAAAVPGFRQLWKSDPQPANPLRPILEPHALDDAGSMCAAMIKSARAGIQPGLRPIIDDDIRYISSKEFRLPDGTLARNRPQRNTLWLDDLYMSVPALAQMGKLTGDRRYYDDGARQVLQFARRMFVSNKGLFIHGWVQDMDVHPEFFWGRANGWALLAMTELLDALPQDHPQRPAILELYRAHVRGIAGCQSGTGLWRQLLDRNDSYLETSASAIFTYCIAHGINQRWLDPAAYGPAAVLGWNGLSVKVNALGQVEGTCVGTGMGFDPAFYYSRPTHPAAAHGYGPTLMAGAEMLTLLKNFQIVINETSVMFYPPGVDWKNLQIK
jgi:unsaturated rhamnogalacturonyl hydrolase